MFILGLVGGFIVCLFMPSAIQMSAKNLMSDVYNKIRNSIGEKDTKDIKY